MRRCRRSRRGRRRRELEMEPLGRDSRWRCGELCLTLFTAIPNLRHTHTHTQHVNVYNLYIHTYTHKYIYIHTHTHTLQLDPPPSYIQSRIELFDRLKAEYDAMIAGNSHPCQTSPVPHPLSSPPAKESRPIKVTLPDGKEVEGQSWRTTPYDVACGISKGLADNVVIAKVRGSNQLEWI